jgi:hypothetical protein
LPGSGCLPTRTTSISVTAAADRVTRCRHLWDALCSAYRALGFDAACDHDEVFQALVLARLIEPTNPTINRRVPVYATEQWRRRLAGVSAAHVGLGPATLVIYDVTMLYFEMDEGDGFRQPGFSKERRLEPQAPWAC